MGKRKPLGVSKMNEDEFLERLRQTPRDWAVSEDGRIRRPLNICPLDAVRILFNELPRLAFRGAIMFAADRHSMRLYSDGRQLRQRLLEACGLEESDATFV